MALVYADKAQAIGLYTDFFGQLFETTPFLAKLKEKSISVMYVFPDIDVYMSIDADGLKWDNEAKESEPTVTMTMNSETVHKYWLKKVNLPMALLKGDIKTEGPFPKIMELLPLLKKGYEIYPKFCEKYNIPKK